MEKACMTIQGVLATIIAYISAKLGVLFWVLVLLMIMMILDYVTGMMASKAEALEHPGDSSYGWSSKKGAKGIIKKVGYLCIIAVAMVVDFIVLRVTAEIGVAVTLKAFFGLLVAVWYLLNELLSIAENSGRMGAPVPTWLTRYIAVLQKKVNSQINTGEEEQLENY